MKKLIAIVLAVMLLAMGLGAGIVAASDINPGSPGEVTTSSVGAGCTPAAQPGTILLLDNTSGEGATALTAFTYAYDNVSAAGFATANLDAYDIIFVAWDPSQAMVNALNLRSAALETWIKYGGGIVVNAEFKNPGVTNPYSFLPVTYDTDADFDHVDGVNIVATSHPLVSGLTSAQLDNWGNSVHGEITTYPAGATIVSVATALGDSPHITGMCYYGGKIVVAATDPEYHYFSYGGCQLLSNELVWASQPCLMIDIKPCSDPNSINLRSKGVVPVAILGTADFDAATVDPETVELTGSKGSADAVKWEFVDVCDHEVFDGEEWVPVGDGYLDLLVYFSTPELKDGVLATTDTEAILTGETFDGVAVGGMDSVRIVTKGPKGPP